MSESYADIKIRMDEVQKILDNTKSLYKDKNLECKDFEDKNKELNIQMGEIHTYIKNIEQLAESNMKLLEDNGQIGGNRLTSSRFSDYTMKKLQKIAKNYGIGNVQKYKNKKELLIALQILSNFKRGGNKRFKRNHLEQIALNLDIYSSDDGYRQLKKKIKNCMKI